jgi:hypothetical protein
MTIPEGIYRHLPFADYKAAEGISQSELKRFGEAATPLHYKALQPKEPTPDMEFGTVCHSAILTPDKFTESYHLKPEEYPAEVKGVAVNKPWNGNADWCKQWLAEHDDRPVMTREQLVKVGRIVERVKRLPEFGAALQHGQTEVSFFQRDEETGLMLKARADLMASARDGTTYIFDPKKVQSGEANQNAFGKSAYSYGYHIQASSYLSITGATRFIFVPFDDSEPFDACQWEPDYDFRLHGLHEWRRLLRAYADCVQKNEWPGYEPGIGFLRLPSFVKKDL